MALFKAQLTWSQFTQGEIVEISDEEVPNFANVIPRWLKPYTDDDVIVFPAVQPPGDWITDDEPPPVFIDGVRMVDRPDPTRVIQEWVEPPDPGPQE